MADRRGLFSALAWPPSLGIGAGLDAREDAGDAGPADAETEWELA